MILQEGSDCCWVGWLSRVSELLLTGLCSGDASVEGFLDGRCAGNGSCAEDRRWNGKRYLQDVIEVQKMVLGLV